MTPYLLAVAAFAALSPPAAAQQQARPNPADPAAPVSAFKHDSAFAGYRGFREEPLAPWRDANDETARAGGHTGIVGGAHGARGASKPTSKPPASGMERK
jgi:hypothetical protein